MTRKKQKKKIEKVAKPSPKIAPVATPVANNRRPKFSRKWLYAGAAIVLLFLILFGAIRLKSHFAASGNRLPFFAGNSPYAPQKPPTVQTKNKVRESDFIGAGQCVSCHTGQYTLWRNSTHGRAGGEPGNTKIVAKFDNRKLQFRDAVVIPSITQDGDYIFRVTEAGRPEETVKVSAVVGGGHMEGGGNQAFFSKYPDGTLRFLPFDFSKTSDVWFVQLKNLTWVPIGKNVSIHNLAHWPPSCILGTEDRFSNCQNCHGSQILVEPKKKWKRFETDYTTLQINCESCHGPGRNHVERMKSAGADTLTDIGIISFYALDKDQSVNRCLECHAEKAALRNDFLSGDPFESYYSLKFPIMAGEPFLPDGRIRIFAYQQNHIFSDCYIDGSMTCVDCHEPHSLKYRDVFWKPIPGKFDDRQCTSCHPSKGLDPERHSHHKKDSPGNVCTACHMPYLQHRLLGNDIQFGRSDHTIPIPRPAFDAQMGIENACQKCHRDKDIAWQQQKTEDWWATLKPHHQQIINNMQAKKVTDIREAAKLLLNPELNYPAAQVSGLFDFMKRFLKPNMPSLADGIVDKLEKLADSNDPDLSSLALVSLHLAADQKKDVRLFLVDKLHSLGDKEYAIRTRWAFAMDYLGTLFSLRKDIGSAIIAHKKALEINPYDPFTMGNLAMAYLKTGDRTKAIAILKEAIHLDSTRAIAYFQLAYVYSLNREKQKAIDALQKGLKYDPDNSNAKRMLQQLKS